MFLFIFLAILLAFVVACIWAVSITLNVLFVRGLNNQEYWDAFAEESVWGKTKMLLGDVLLAPLQPLQYINAIELANILYEIPLTHSYWGYVKQGYKLGQSKGPKIPFFIWQK